MNNNKLRILTLGYDGSGVDPDSKLAKRSREYASVVDRYILLVPAAEAKKTELSENCFAYSVKQPPGPLFISRLLVLYSMYKQAKNIIKKENCNVVSTQDPFELGLIGYLLKRKLKIALNMQEHGDFFSANYWRNENIINFIRFYIGRFLIKRADSVRAVSKRIKTTLANKLSIAEKKIVVVPIYIDIQAEASQEPFAELKDKYKDKFLFLNIGRFVKQKNLPLLVQAFSEISQIHPEARLLMAGKGPLRHGLKELVKGLKLGNKIEFIDWIDDVYAYYHLADAYVLSSNYEGWGMVIVEAAASGLPIVMTDVGCAGEFVENKSSALITKVNNKEEFVRAMDSILSNSVLRKKLQKGASSALANLPNKEKTLRLYKESWQKAITQD